MSSPPKGRRLPSRDELEALAARSTGLDDFGDPYFRNGLDALLASLEREVELNFLGRLMIRRAILNALEQRLRLEDLRLRNPQLMPDGILPPLIITGLPRSGTTFLHRLLAEELQFYAPPLWQMVAPALPAGSARARLHRLRLKAEMAVFNRVAPSLDAKHFTRVDEPEECIFLTASTFHSPIFWTLAPVYSFLTWYARADRVQKYRDYARMLRLLQASAPARRLLLKAPDHLGGLAELLAVVPDATIAVCLRDPGEAVASLNSLLMTLHAGTTRNLDPPRMAEVSLAGLVEDTRHYLDGRPALCGRIVEVPYRDIVGDASGAAAHLYQKAGLSFGPDTRKRIDRFIAANPQHRRGTHSYRLEEFGQTAEAIHARFGAFADLCRN